MASLNQVQLIGHLGQDPEVRYMPNGDAVANVSLATSETWKDKSSGERKEKTEWHRVTLYRGLAEIAGQYLKKGSQVFFQGKLQTRKWTDKEGVERYTTEIVADDMLMLGGGGRGANDNGGGGEPRQQPQGGNGGAPKKKAPSFDDMDDDIPF